MQRHDVTRSELARLGLGSNRGPNMKAFTKLLAGIALALAAVWVRFRARGKPEVEPVVAHSSKVNVLISRDNGETLATFQVDRDLID